MKDMKDEKNTMMQSPDTQASSSQTNSLAGADHDEDSVCDVVTSSEGAGSICSRKAAGAAEATPLLSLSERMERLQAEVEALKQRNFEKDRGKEYEGSYTRIFFLMMITYWTLFAYMYIIETNNPFLDAIVPTVGFNISTWKLPFVKEWWIQANHYYTHGETESASMRRRQEEAEAARRSSCNVVDV